MNLLTPYSFLCFLCEETITLDAAGGLSDYKKHLVRHKTGLNVCHRDPACKLIARWVELDSNVDKLTEVPIELTIKYRHVFMICLKTPEERKKDPSYDVLMGQGQRTLQFDN